jgi:hypothetical protein
MNTKTSKLTVRAKSGFKAGGLATANHNRGLV